MIIILFLTTQVAFYLDLFKYDTHCIMFHTQKCRVLLLLFDPKSTCLCTIKSTHVCLISTDGQLGQSSESNMAALAGFKVKHV